MKLGDESIFFLIELIHSMQGWTATTRDGIQEKEKDENHIGICVKNPVY